MYAEKRDRCTMFVCVSESFKLFSQQFLYRWSAWSMSLMTIVVLLVPPVSVFWLRLQELFFLCRSPQRYPVCYLPHMLTFGILLSARKLQHTSTIACLIPVMIVLNCYLQVMTMMVMTNRIMGKTIVLTCCLRVMKMMRKVMNHALTRMPLLIVTRVRAMMRTRVSACKLMVVLLVPVLIRALPLLLLFTCYVL